MRLKPSQMKRWLGPVRILLDTNILISGILSKTGPPSRLLEAYKSNSFVLVTSPSQLAEFKRVLNYSHIRQRITRSQASVLLETIDVNAVLVWELPTVDYSPDPDDNVIIATAIAGGADMIVSGDKRDMLALAEVEGIPIVSARDAVKLLSIADT